MSERNGLLRRNFRVFLLLAVFAAVIYLIVRNIGAFGNVLLVVIGFGVMILVHELGHFTVAKLSGITIKAFSIGFPPTLVGVLRTENGYRVRILPGFFRTKDEKSDGSLVTFIIGRKAQPGETEYRIGLIPFGGYNKILGQEDTKAVETGDDPRSFANKSVGVRMAVIAAGVIFNAISAILIFTIVFLVGIRLTPPVVGGVTPNNPAARAGLKHGDEIVEIAGKRDNLDFRNILMAAALAGKNEAVKLKVRRTDSLEEKEFAIVPERSRDRAMRGFGILPPQSLTIAKLSEADARDLQAKTGLLGGDRVISVNGKDVDAYWELKEIVQKAFVPSVTILAKRTDPVSKKIETIESQVRLNFSPAKKEEVKPEADLNHIYSIVPRLRVTAVAPVPDKNRVTSLLGKIKNKLLALFGKANTKEEYVDTGDGLESGDIILAIGDVENPTFKEMRDVTTKYKDQELPVKILRTSAEGVEKVLTVTVVPRSPQGSDGVFIGVGVALDMEHPVVAKTIAAEGSPAKLEIPRGASITAVDKTDVSNFYDVIREIRRYDGERVSIDWRINEEVAGDVAFTIDNSKDFVTVQSTFAEPVPFKILERLYKADGPIDAIVIGSKRTLTVVVQTYVSIKCLIAGLVGQEELSGPIGMIAISYQIAARRPLIEYVRFFGIISILLAVFNLLPIPPVDGGWLVLLMVEKIKGSALSERVQEVVAYAGITFILGLFIYLTFNDILNILFR